MSNNKDPADNQLEDFKNSVKVNYFTKILFAILHFIYL